MIALKKLNKEKVQDVIVRAYKTFMQAFFSSITINSFFVVKDVGTFKTVLYSTLIAGASAGISAVWNMIVNSMSE